MDVSQTLSRSEFTSLVPALSKVLERVGEGRLELSVSVCDTVEVQVLKKPCPAAGKRAGGGEGNPYKSRKSLCR